MSIKNQIVLAGIVFLIFITCLALMNELTKVTYEYSQEEAKIEQKKETLDAWLDKLVAHECPNCPKNYKRIDVNGKFSYGCLQFQLATFRSKSAQYGIEISDGDAIYSCEIQREIAVAMFNDNPKEAAGHWYTSVYKKGLGLPPETQ